MKTPCKTALKFAVNCSILSLTMLMKVIGGPAKIAKKPFKNLRENLMKLKIEIM